MLHLDQKKDMGLEASLKLLDLPPDAGIDDANRAYAQLHQMIDTYHDGLDDDDGSGRHEDLNLLTCAYEKAVAHFSSLDAPPDTSVAMPSATAGGHVGSTAADDFAIDLPVSASHRAVHEMARRSPHSDGRTLAGDIAETSERLKQAESSLPAAGAAVDAATAAVKTAEQRLATARDKRVNAEVAARSAKTRARLLEIEANRTMEDALALAQKARQRVLEARQAARQADEAATAATEQAGCMNVSEKKAADEAMQVRQQLEAAQTQVRDLSHGLVDARRRLELLNRRVDSAMDNRDPVMDHEVVGLPSDRGNEGGKAADRQAVLQDLLEIEASLKTGRQTVLPDHGENLDRTGRTRERRRYERLVYPAGEEPMLHMDGQHAAILDLSPSGMRLAGDADIGHSRFVRGTIDFAGRSPLSVTGKVVHHDAYGFGVKLVTRIGHRMLDRERMRLNA